MGRSLLVALFLVTPSGWFSSHVSFRDRAPEVGLDFRQDSSPTSEKYLIETMGGGCALLDYDGDGFLDIFLTNGAQLEVRGNQPQSPRKVGPQYSDRLYRNRDGESFIDITAQAGLEGAGFSMGTAVGDIDNDGWSDLYVTRYGSNSLYRNNGDGTFRDHTVFSGVAADGWSASAGFFDYDRDGYLDLFVARYLDWSFETHKFCTDLLRGFPLGSLPEDLTGRDRSYCHPQNYTGLTDLLFRNRGDLTFENVSQAVGISRSGNGLGVAFSDFDQDGWPDVYVANDGMEAFLYRNGGSGIFHEEALLTGVAFDRNGNAVAGMGTDFGDFNNDGWPDLIVTDLSYENYLLFKNSGKGFFQEVSRETGVGLESYLLSGWGVGFIDFDLDGWVDLFLANSHVMDNIETASPDLTYKQKPMLLGNQRGRFVDLSESAGSAFEKPAAARGACFGDIDNDGDIDVLLNSLNEPVRLLYNESDSAGSWLLVRLVGRTSNREGVGARLHLKSGNLSIWRTASRSGSYLSAHDARIHFGLGGESQVGELEILWPSGIRQTLKEIPANQILTVQEPLE